MMTNESTVDRIIRVVIWVAALVVAFAVGAILVLTGAVGFCPLYRVLGISTYPVPQR